jgi:hypothetical protein
MKRSQKAYALVSIIVLSAMSLAFLMALATVVQQASGTISQNKYDLQLLNAAEIGMDYAISQFNTQSPCHLDPASGQQLLVTTLPAGTYPNDLSGIAINITVKNILAQSDWQNFQQISSIYNTQLNPFSTSNSKVNLSWQNLLNGSLTTSGYRIIESQAVRNGASRTIRSFIQARFDPSPNFTPAAPVGSSQNPFFANPMFSNGQMNVAPASGSLTVGASSGAPLTINTNTQVTLGTGAKINGNVQVLTALSGPAVPPTSTTPTAVFSSPGGYPNTFINGRLTVNSVAANGNVGSTVTSTPGAQPNLSGENPDNVLATLAGNPRSGLNASAPSASGPTANGTGTAANQIQIAPSLTESSTSTSFPAITSGSNGSTPSSTVLAGDYVATGLATSSFEVPASMGLSTDVAGTPVRIFVQDGMDQNAVQIDSSMMTNASGIDSNLQIWYSGSNQVTLNLNSPSFSGLIYAPNATVNVTGSGSYTGAIVAGLLNATNSGSINIDTNIATASGAAALGLTYSPNSTGSQITGWQPVTWQELKP